MAEMKEIRIGGRDAEFVSIRKLSSCDPEGWFAAEITVQCDGWRGKFGASFMKGELTRFAEEIQKLHENLRGEAMLAPLEPNLTLNLKGDGKGHIDVMGTAQNRLGLGTQLSFSLEIFQSYLPMISENLRAADG